MAITKITTEVIADGAITSSHLASGAVTHSSLSGITTDNVTEGSTNVYHTAARARGSVSVTGGGLTYDSGTGVIQIASIPNASLANSSLTVNSNSVSLGGSVTLDTDDIGEGSTNLYFTNARAQSAISGGTGVTVSGGTISIGQDVATSSTPTFGNITTTGYIAGPATFTIDPAAVGDNTGTVVIAGNLQVDGTTTTINSTTLTVDDKLVTLASGSINAAAADGAGVEVEISGATNPSLTYDGTNDKWNFNKPLTLENAATADMVIAETTSNNTRSFITTKSKDSSGNSIELKVGTLGDIPAGMLFTLTNHDLTFATNNASPQMTLDTSGHLGIGTTDPVNLLHVSKNTTASSWGTYPTIQIDNPNAAGYASLAFTQGSTASDIRFRIEADNSNDRLIIAEGGSGLDGIVLDGATGNVGIGYGTPSNALSVSGVMTIGNFTSVAIGGTPADLNTAEVGPGYINLARDDTADAKQLLFGKNGAVHSYLETTSTGLNIESIRDVVYRSTNTNSTAGHHIFKSYNTEIMRIDGANNRVGINEQNPAVPLHVTKDSSSGENIAFMLDNNNTTAGNEIGMLFRSMVGSTNTDFEIFGVANGANDMDLVFQSDGSVERVRFTGDGNVIIKDGDLVFSATSTHASNGNVSISIPDRAATIYNVGDRGNITIQASSATSGAQAMSGGRVLINAGNSNNGQSGDIILSSGVNVLNSNDRGKIRFNVGGRTTNEEVMRIHSNLNVGIGTDGPSEKLQVAGNVGISNGGALKLFPTDASDTNPWTLYQYSDDTLRFNFIGTGADEIIITHPNATNATTLYVDTEGKRLGVGGITDPVVPLEVVSDSGANGIRIRGRSSNDYGFLGFTDNAGTTLWSEIAGIPSGLKFYRDSTTQMMTMDTDGLHFEKVDGQSITAKESIVMTVDRDNNTASRVFMVNHGNGKSLLTLHDDYRADVGTLQYSSTRSAGATSASSFTASAGDWVDIATVPYGRNVGTVKIWWDAIYAPASSHHGLMEFDIGSHYGTSYYYGWDSYINLKTSSAHNSFYISEARIISPGGAGATGYFQVKFGVATNNGTVRAYVTSRDESCTIAPMTPAVNNSRSGTTIASIQLGTAGGLVNNRVSLATSRDMHIGGGLTLGKQPGFFAYKNGTLYETNGLTLVQGWTEDFDVASNFNASTGQFTCPTAGIYYFNFSAMSGQTSGDTQYRIYQNSNYIVGSNSMAQGSGPWRQTTISGLFNCAQGDVLAAYAYSNVSSSVQMVYDNRYSHVHGYLLG